MKKVVRVLPIIALALMVFFVMTPKARANSIGFDYAFTTQVTNASGSSAVFAFGNLQGTPLGNGWYQALTGTINLTGSLTPAQGTGTLISGGPQQTISPSGYFYFDNGVNPAPGSGNPFVDNGGLLFNVGGTEVNLYSNSPFTGPNDYILWENNGFHEQGSLNLAAVTPEPASLLLLGTGFAFMAVVLYRRRLRPGSGVAVS